MAPNVAQAGANKRQRLTTIDDANADSSPNEKPPDLRGFQNQREALTIADSDGKAERGGFEPPVGLKPYTDLANRRIRPLCHLSDPRADGRNYTGHKTESNLEEIVVSRGSHEGIVGS